MTEEKSESQKPPLKTNWWLAILLPVVATALFAVTEGWRYALGLEAFALAIVSLMIGDFWVIQRVRK